MLIELMKGKKTVFVLKWPNEWKSNYLSGYFRQPESCTIRAFRTPQYDSSSIQPLSMQSTFRKLNRLAPNLSQIFLQGWEWNQKLTSPAVNHASRKECLCDLRYSWYCWWGKEETFNQELFFTKVNLLFPLSHTISTFLIKWLQINTQHPLWFWWCSQ